MTRAALTPRRPWEGRRILLGVCGGIAAYKCVQLARDLTRLGAQVDVVMTRAAERFVAPLSFEGVTGRPVHRRMHVRGGAALHISLGMEADVVCVAPATADLIARAAQGRSDDLLASTLLVTRAPVLICPAMNDRMYAHMQVQANLQHLRGALGYYIAGPGVGPLAAGEGEGPGRLLEVDEIVEHVGRALAGVGGDASWSGRRVLVTAGPTREALDPVRYLGNRSSGRMGYAVARAAWRRGADVTLVAGPTELADPTGVRVVHVEDARSMHDAVSQAIGSADVTVFAAAVADFRPADPAGAKLKTRDVEGDFSIVLTRNPDIAAETRPSRRPGGVVVGFALETDDLIVNAEEKRVSKGFDLVVANPADEPGAGFGGDTNRAVLVGPDGAAEALPTMPKDALAEVILDRVERIAEWE